jgi:tetratricopeptide (TPR) repeat protein
MTSNISSLLEQSIQSFKIANFKKTKLLLLKVLELQSNNFDAIHLLGVLSGIEDNHHKAFNYFKVAIKIKPKNHLAHFNLAKALSKLGNDTEAIEHYSISIKLKSDYAEAWNNKGVSLSNLKQYEESLSYYDQAIQLKSNYAEAWNNKGVSLKNLKRYEESLSYYDQAIKLKLDYVGAWNNKGVSLNKLKRYEESLSYYDQAIKLKPDYAEAWNNKGVSLKNLKRYEESLSYYDQAIKLKPDYAEARHNKGASLNNLKRYEESLSYYDQAIKLKPDYAEPWYGKAETKLILADFQDGWNLYMFRWKQEDFERYRYPQFKELESINKLDNKKILIWHEQGMGDTIQFSRYVSKLVALGAVVTFEVQKDLVCFFKKQFECEVTDQVSINKNFDYQAPLLNLPYVFNTSIDTIPNNQAYLKVKKENVIDWNKKIKLSKNKLNIGIAISGNPNQKNNHIRSIPLENMKSIFQYANFFIIQKELSVIDMEFLKKYPEIKFIGEEIVNFSDTAAIVENMDLIISIDTSLIHLAGAMGKKCFLMLSWSPEWRWLLDRSDSPWYKSIKIFRQKLIGDWNSVINQIEFELKKLI